MNSLAAMLRITATLLFGLALTAPGLAQAGPFGDTCADPIPITGEGAFAWTNAGRTTSGFDGNSVGPNPLCWGPQTTEIQNDVFFVWTAPCPGSYSILVTSGDIANCKRSVHLLGDCSANCVGGIDDLFFNPFLFVANVATGDEILIQCGSTDFGDTGSGFIQILHNGGPCFPTDLTFSCPQPNPHGQGGFATLMASTVVAGTPDTLHLECVDGPVDEFGFCLVSAGNSAAVPLFNGVLCLESPQGRYNPQVAANQGLPALNSLGRFDGTGVLQNLSGTSITGTGFDVPATLPFTNPAGQAIQSGSTWSFQYWFRDVDPGGMPSASFSDVLTLTF